MKNNKNKLKIIWLKILETLKKPFNLSKKSQVEKEITGFKKLESRLKRKEKLRALGNRGRVNVGLAGKRISKFLEKIKYTSRLPKQSILKAKVKRDKRGIIIMDSGFIEELKEKVSGKEHHLKGKWLKINPLQK
tara:strand:+ start:106 stop:507 length:402 start_codon:yes stop_codon:yes gene_type:complete